MEPVWLQERRQRALEQYTALPIPAKGEGWIRTNFAKDKIETLAPLTQISNGVKAEEIAAWLPTPLLSVGSLLYGEKNSHPFLEESVRQQGVILLPLAKALEQFPDKIAPFLGTVSCDRDNKLIAQNDAYWNTGVFLYIPKDCALSGPIVLVQNCSSEGTSLLPRVVVVAEAGSKTTVVHYAISQNKEKINFVNGIFEIYVQQNAQLNWIDLQNLGENTFDFAWKRVEVAQGATFNGFLELQGGRKGKWDLEVCLKGPGAKSEIVGLVQLNKKQHLELNSLTHHTTPETTANILVKTSVTDEARSVFQGMIRIEKAAQKTNSYMANHNLLLSDHCHADTIPRLEIEADDVKASHGATISHVDSEQMFYLQSRGLETTDACQLLVDGFYEDIFGRIPVPEVRELMRKNTQRKQEAA